jgi:hypothetical protein
LVSWCRTIFTAAHPFGETGVDHFVGAREQRAARRANILTQ